MSILFSDLKWGQVNFGTRLNTGSVNSAQIQNLAQSHAQLKLHVVGPAGWDALVTRYSASTGAPLALAKKMAPKPLKTATKAGAKTGSKKKLEVTEFKLNAPRLEWVSFEGEGGIAVLGVHEKTAPYFLHEALRRALASRLAQDKNWNIELEVEGYSAETVFRALVILCEVSRWRPLTFGKRAQEKGTKKLQKKSQDKKSEAQFYTSITLVSTIAGSITGVSEATQKSWFDQSMLEACAINRCRYLVELPGNVLKPASYRKLIDQLVAQLARKSPRVRSQFLGVPQLKKKGAGSLLAVLSADPKSQGGVAYLVYSPTPLKQKHAKKRIILVGKGLCFDTGGYDVKVGGSMVGMHKDMGGSAVALALFALLAEQKVDFEVECYLAIAENLIGPEGYKPGDVVVAANGTSIEVIDTDAEGRMVLCDTLALASEAAKKEGGCDLILDFATLTGSMVRAIGTKRSGFVTNQGAELVQTVWAAGDASGERVWPFPYAEEYLDRLKSDVADLRQCSTAPGVDHILAAAFMGKFVDEEHPWVHVDLSADGNSGGLGLVSTDTTAFGVRFGRELIERVVAGK